MPKRINLIDYKAEALFGFSSLLLFALYLISAPTILIFIVFLALLSVAAVFSPWIALVFFAGFRPAIDVFQRETLFSLGGLSFNPGMVLSVGLIFFGIAYLLKVRFNPLHDHIVLSFTLLVFIILAGSLYSSNLMLAVSELFRYAGILMVFVLSLKLLGKVEFKRVATLLIIASFMPACIALLQFAGWDRAYSHTYLGSPDSFGDYFREGRLTGSLSSPAGFGIYMLFLCAVCLTLAFLSKDFKARILGLSLFLSYSILLFMSQTRMVILALIGFIVLFVFFKDRRMIIPSILVLCLILLFPPVFNQFSMLYQGNRNAVSTLSYRLNVWDHMSLEVFGSPFFGNGVKAFEDSYQKEFGIYYEPHNVYLALLSYTGFIGLALYLIISYLILKNSFIYSQKGGTPLLGVFLFSLWLALMACYLTTNFAFRPVIQYPIWLIVGLLVSVYSSSKT